MQGVGFRPFVYRLAGELELAGWVLNDERGVLLEVEGEPAAVERFLERLAAEAPPLAVVERVSSSEVQPAGERDFRIVESVRGGDADALVAPDAATCADCLAELFDPGDRRYRYPFINCTNCGPRFTIVARRPLRPAADHDGRLRDVPALPGRVRGPGRPPLPRPAQRVPGVRPVGAAARARRRARPTTTRCGAARGAARRRGSSPSRASAATTSPAAPTTSARSRRCEPASTARTSRSR